MNEDRTPHDDLEPTRAAQDDLDSTRSARPADAARPGPPPLPESIGQYVILSKLGQGGMGIVFEAKQQQPRRKVALKVVRGGSFIDERHVRMFQREADALARLKHPNIAAIYESGRTDDGQHFFAMELVRGQTLDAYLRNRPGAVTPQEVKHRLGLLLKVADAVHYAHQRGVIHRDLKPSNIVVTREATREPGSSGVQLPEIKILDFGLARITEGDLAAATMTTELGVIKGTLPYMSPEQARGRSDAIDVRTDVYSLGVILYEMLAGCRPYDVLQKSLVEAVRVICEEPPRALSETWSGVRKLDPDVATIVGKALEKDADRRYASAAALSEDVSRHLASQPILAHPPSALYQLRKFAGRNRALVGGIVATFVALLVGTFVSVAFALQAQVQRKAAVNEAETASQALDFMVGMFEVSDPSEARGNSITAREILDKGATQIDETLGDQPEVQARLMTSMGEVYRKLGLYSDAGPLLEQAVATQTRVLGAEHPDTLNSMNNLATLYWNSSRDDEAEAFYRKTLEIRRRLLGDEHPDTLSSMNNLGDFYWSHSGYDEAESLYRETLETRRQILGDEHPDTLVSINKLAVLYWRQGRRDRAEELYDETLEIQRQLLGDDHPETLRSMNALALLYWNRGRHDEAEAMHLETLAARRRVLGDDHPETLRSMNALGILYRKQGRYDEAEPLYLETLETRKRVLGNEHRDTLSSMNNLATLYDFQGRYDEAEPLCLETLEIRRRVLGDDNVTTLISMSNLANVYQQQGRHDEAEAMHLETLEGRKRVLGHDAPKTIRTMGNLIRLYLATGKLDRARRLVSEQVELRKQAAERPDASSDAKNDYARLLLSLEPEDMRDPHAALDAALEVNDLTGYDDPGYLDTLALAYHMTGDATMAIETQKEAIALVPDSDSRLERLERSLATFEAARDAGQ